MVQRLYIRSIFKTIFVDNLLIQAIFQIKNLISTYFALPKKSETISRIIDKRKQQLEITHKIVNPKALPSINVIR